MHRNPGNRNTRIGLATLTALLMTATACSNSDTGSMADGDAEGGAAEEYAAPDAPMPQTDGNFEDYGTNPEVDTSEDNQSTFALDVDTGSYPIVRDYLNQGFLPDEAAVRTEEVINYFPQDYEPPDDGIGIHVDGTTVPFLDDPSRRVLRVGLQAAEVDDADRQPVTLTFVIDRSGSMQGGNMEMVQSALHLLVDSLRPDDEVGIVTYSDDAELELDVTPVSEESALRDAIDGLASDGGTNTEAGLRLGYEHALDNLRDDGVNRVVLLSDGVANQGETDPDVLAEEVAQPAGDDVQLLTVGVGMEVFNDTLLERLADQGNGFYAFVDSPHEAERLFVEDLTGTLEPVALDARVQVTFDPETVENYRLLGYENREVADEEFRDEDTDGGEVGAGHSATALYEVTLPESSPGGDAELAEVDVVWADPDTGEMTERSDTLSVGDLDESFEDAPDRLRQTILVAAFAEGLRGAPWGEEVSLDGVAANAQALADTMPDDEAIQEFADLADTAAGI